MQSLADKGIYMYIELNQVANGRQSRMMSWTMDMKTFQDEIIMSS